MKTIKILLLTFSLLNYQMQASQAEETNTKPKIHGYRALKSLSDDQQNVLLYLCWKPVLKTVETAIKTQKKIILETKTDKQATHTGLAISNEPLYISMGKIDPKRKAISLCFSTIANGPTRQYGAKFSTMTCTFDQFKANILQGKNLFDQHGYDLFAGSCITINSGDKT